MRIGRVFFPADSEGYGGGKMPGPTGLTSNGPEGAQIPLSPP